VVVGIKVELEIMEYQNVFVLQTLQGSLTDLVVVGLLRTNQNTKSDPG
jgi:hypothetical protein